MEVRPHEVVNGEVVLAVVKPSAASDDLLELDHGVDRAHEHDVADISGIHAGRELLRGGQNRRDGFFVVLKVSQVLVAEFTIVRGDPVAIVRIGARLHLIDEVAHGQRMVLCGAEDQSFLALVDLVHEYLHAVRFAFLDLDDLVEVGFRVALSTFNFALHHKIVRRVDVFVEGSGDLLYPERREKAVIDALPQRVDIDRLAEVGVGVRVLLALRGCGQPELNSGSEVFHDAAPIAFVIGPAAMAFVDDDEIEEVGWILAEVGRGLAILRRTAHEGLEDGEEHAGVLWDFAFLANVVGADSFQRVFGKRGEGCEVVVGLVGEIVAVGEEENTRAASRFSPALPIRQIPAGIEELPRDLECNGCFPRAGGQR